MGHRTLVAVARPDGRFDCRLARWGVNADPGVQSTPVDSGLSPAAVLESLDCAIERLVVVRQSTLTTYVVCWLDPTLADPDDVAVARTEDPTGLRDWWTDAKSDACDAVARGVDAETARAGLLAALRAHADAVFVGDASFLRRGR